MKDIYIVGAGGFGREVLWLIQRINQSEKLWNIKGFIDDSNDMIGKTLNGFQVLGNIEYLNSLGKNAFCVCAIGNPKTRKTVTSRLNNVSFATLIDPSVIISNEVKIGEGTIICANSAITVNIEIGKHVLINLGCTIGHDDLINDYVTLYPSVNVSGNVKLGEMCEVGTGTKIIQGKKVIEECIIGAGAVVVKDIEEKGTYVGVPAQNRSKKA